MRLWHLKVFNEIMASGTISQAAKNLKRTQSSISAALSNLEKRIGYQLFIRKKRRLHAVPEAYFLKEEGESILQQVEFLDQAIGKKNEISLKPIKIASMPLLAEILIPSIISKFKKNTFIYGSTNYKNKLSKNYVNISLINEFFSLIVLITL